MLHERGIAPWRLTRPYVGFSPTTPLYAAGRGTDAPVSEPSAPNAARVATATAEPLDEPPGMCAALNALRQWPKWMLCPVGPAANSAIFRTPISIAPAASSRSSTVAVAV